MTSSHIAVNLTSFAVVCCRQRTPDIREYAVQRHLVVKAKAAQSNNLSGPLNSGEGAILANINAARDISISMS